MFKKGSYLYYAAANGMFYFAFGTFASIIAVVLAGRSMSATQISLISSAASLFAMVFQPLAGFFADKIRSPKKVGIVCLVAAIVSALGFGYSHSFILLFMMNGFTQGFLNGTVGLSDRLAVASKYPYGTIRAWGSVMYAIAAQLSGYVYDHYPSVVIYYIFAIGAVLAVVGFIGMIDVVADVEEGHEKVTSKEVFNALSHNKRFLLFVAILCIYQGSFAGQFTYFPLFIQELGGTTTMVGTTLLLTVFSEIPSIFFSDRIFAKFKFKSVMIFACIMTLFRYGWYATLPSPQLIMIVFFFQGLSSILMILVSVRIIVEVVDEKYVNSAFGISSMMARGLFSLIFVIIAGRIIDTVPGVAGYRIIYLVSCAAVVIVLGLVLRFKEDEA